MVSALVPYVGVGGLSGDEEDLTPLLVQLDLEESLVPLCEEGEGREGLGPAELGLCQRPHESALEHDQSPQPPTRHQLKDPTRELQTRNRATHL